MLQLNRQLIVSRKVKSLGSVLLTSEYFSGTTRSKADLVTDAFFVPQNHFSLERIALFPREEEWFLKIDVFA